MESYPDRDGVIAIPSTLDQKPFKDEEGNYIPQAVFYFLDEINGLWTNSDVYYSAEPVVQQNIEPRSDTMAKTTIEMTAVNERSRTYSFVGAQDLVISGVAKFAQEADGSHRLETDGGVKLFVQGWNVLIIDADDWSV